jgi:hypothetical protein
VGIYFINTTALAVFRFREDYSYLALEILVTIIDFLIAITMVEEHIEFVLAHYQGQIGTLCLPKVVALPQEVL